MKKNINLYVTIFVLSGILILSFPAVRSFAMTNMTEKIQLVESSWRKDAKGKKKSIDVALVNVSEDVVWAPIKVVIESLSAPNVFVSNSDGFTPDDNMPFFLYTPNSGMLEPGESTDSKEWEFTYPKNKIHFGHDLNFTIRVLACTDADHDGFFLEDDCGTPPDCNDLDPDVHPGSTEVCDGIDNNCDGGIDEGVLVTFWNDSDLDTYGNLNAPIEACSAPDGYVQNYEDCNDENRLWWLKDNSGGCAFSGYTDCTSPYEQDCNPSVSDVLDKFKHLNIDVNRDSFAYGDFQTPGGWSSEKKRHLQSIQFFDRYYSVSGQMTYQPFLAVTMSDETDTDAASISIVSVDAIGSEVHTDGPGYDDDIVVSQTLLNDHPLTAPYNHPGGTQLIGEYLFVAMEDFEGEEMGEPIVGIFKINRNGVNPRIDYHDSFYPMFYDRHNAAVAVTKMSDGSFFVAACVEDVGKGCEDIRFFKTGSTITTLSDKPSFEFIDQWHKDEMVFPADISPDVDHWTDCPAQGMNMVVDDSGDIYLVMFGVEGGLECGAALNDDHIYVYKLLKNSVNEIKLEFRAKVDVGTGDACDSIGPIPIKVTGTNFEAGSGLWIRPQGKDDVAILATEHYDSCFFGESRWGVTGNWKTP